MGDHRYLWTDLETTGTDPHHGRILEFAVVLANDGPDGDMSPVDEYSGVLRLLHHERYALEDHIDPFVVRMHNDNGLWSECAESTTMTEEFDELLCELLAGSAERSIMLAGNSVHFDLGWLRVHTPKAAKLLSHRVLDVTTLMSACESWGTPIPRGLTAYRALDDIHNSLAYAKQFRKQVGWLP